MEVPGTATRRFVDAAGVVAARGAGRCHDRVVVVVVVAWQKESYALGEHLRVAVKVVVGGGGGDGSESRAVRSVVHSKFSSSSDVVKGDRSCCDGDGVCYME